MPGLTPSVSPGERARVAAASAACKGLPPPERAPPPFHEEAKRLAETIKEFLTPVPLNSFGRLLGDDAVAAQRAYPSVSSTSKINVPEFFADYRVRGRLGSDLFVVSGLMFAAAGTPAARHLLSEYDAELADTSGCCDAATFELEQLPRVPLFERTINSQQLGEYQTRLSKMWERGQDDREWTPADDTLARSLSKSNALPLCRLLLLLQRTRGAGDELVRPDPTELMDLSVLTQLPPDSRNAILGAKKDLVNYLLAHPDVRYNMRGLQTGQREAADGFQSIAQRQQHQLNADDISQRYQALEGSAQRAYANEAYVSQAALAPFVKVFRDIAATSGCKHSAARLEEAAGRLLSREGLLPSHYLAMLACVFGADASLRGARGGSGEGGTHCEKQRSKKAGIAIGEFFDEQVALLEKWKLECQSAAARGEALPPKPKYEMLLGQVRFAADGAPLLFAQLSEHESLPFEKPSHRQLLTEENDVAGAHEKFYRSVGKSAAPHFAGSLACPPLPTSEERWTAGKRLGGVIAGAIEWCSGARGSLAAKGATLLRGGGWCGGEVGKAMRRQARIAAADATAATPTHRHDYPVVWGYYRIFRRADHDWVGHEFACDSLNTGDEAGKHAAAAYLAHLRADSRCYFTRRS